jgi:hypothetical protein
MWQTGMRAYARALRAFAPRGPIACILEQFAGAEGLRHASIRDCDVGDQAHFPCRALFSLRTFVVFTAIYRVGILWGR